jgi:hypothetical protein
MSGEIASASVALIITMGAAVTGACGVCGFVAVKVLAADRQAMSDERLRDAKAIRAQTRNEIGGVSASASSLSPATPGGIRSGLVAPIASGVRQTSGF